MCINKRYLQTKYELGKVNIFEVIVKCSLECNFFRQTDRQTDYSKPVCPQSIDVGGLKAGIVQIGIAGHWLNGIKLHLNFY